VGIVRKSDRTEFREQGTIASYFTQSTHTRVSDGKMYTVYMHDYLE